MKYDAWEKALYIFLLAPPVFSAMNQKNEIARLDREVVQEWMSQSSKGSFSGSDSSEGLRKDSPSLWGLSGGEKKAFPSDGKRHRKDCRTIDEKLNMDYWKIPAKWNKAHLTESEGKQWLKQLRGEHESASNTNTFPINWLITTDIASKRYSHPLEDLPLVHLILFLYSNGHEASLQNHIELFFKQLLNQPDLWRDDMRDALIFDFIAVLAEVTNIRKEPALKESAERIKTYVKDWLLKLEMKLAEHSRSDIQNIVSLLKKNWHHQAPDMGFQV